MCAGESVRKEIIEGILFQPISTPRNRNMNNENDNVPVRESRDDGEEKEAPYVAEMGAGTAGGA